MKRILMLVLSLAMAAGAYAQSSSLRNYGDAVQLEVDGKPFLVLGGELGNSSAACSSDIETNLARLQRMGLNTVLVPAYWDLIEPVEGQFDFSLTDKVLEQARRNDLKVIFLWFGAWKNSMSCYAPLWFKQDYRKYPRACTKEGKPLEIASAFSENVFKADNRAFAAWLEHIAEADRDYGTVIMIQIENEIGMLEDARDHSKVADRHFRDQVPEELTSYLQSHKENLHPYMSRKWAENGMKTEGTWTEVFGDDIYTDEIFMAWHYAKYVERMAVTARSIYDVPLYVNAAMNSRGRKPGEYPSAGPLAHLKDIWHCAAPSIDFLSPDLYDNGFKDWVAKYDLEDNPLFIPETKHMQNNGVRAFYVFGEHDAIGISPFAIEDGSDEKGTPFVDGYAKLREMMPLITRWQGQDAMWGLLFDQEDKERIIEDGDLVLTCRHNLPCLGIRGQLTDLYGRKEAESSSDWTRMSTWWQATVSWWSLPPFQKSLSARLPDRWGKTALPLQDQMDPLPQGPYGKAPDAASGQWMRWRSMKTDHSHTSAGLTVTRTIRDVTCASL